MSFSETARSSAMLSLTAVSEVPPESKKWSVRRMCCSGTPSSSAQAAASLRSAGLSASRRAPPSGSATGAASAACAVRAFRSILPLAVNGRLSRQWKAAGTM